MPTVFAPHPRYSGLDFLLETLHQFTVGVDKGLLGLDFGDDCSLGFEGRKRDFHSTYISHFNACLVYCSLCKFWFLAEIGAR